jgi:hypothetical protein
LILLSATILIAAGPSAHAQRTYINAQTNSTTARCVLCRITDAANVTDTDHTNFAILNVPIGAGDGSVQQSLIFAASASHENTITLKIGYPGQLLADVLGGLSLETFFHTSSNNDSRDLAGSGIQVIDHPATSTAEIRYRPNRVFDRVQLKLHAGRVTANLRVDVYYAFHEKTAPLPVIAQGPFLSSNSSGIIIKWRTYSERGNKAFLLSRADQTGSYSQLGQLQGKGNSDQPIDYQFIDSQPLAGINYYRLEQLDVDGKLNLVGQAAIRYSLESDRPKAYPNPVTNYTTLHFTDVGYTKIRIIDPSGRVLATKAINKGQRSATLDFSSYPAGHYLIELLGAQRYTTRILKP